MSSGPAARVASVLMHLLPIPVKTFKLLRGQFTTHPHAEFGADVMAGLVEVVSDVCKIGLVA